MGRISSFTGGRFGGIEYWSAPSKYGNIDEYFSLNLEDACSNFTSYLFLHSQSVLRGNELITRAVNLTQPARSR
jgi:hypothetical protein